MLSYLLCSARQRADLGFWVFVLLPRSRMVPLSRLLLKIVSILRPSTSPCLPSAWSKHHYLLKHVFLLNTSSSSFCFWFMVFSPRSGCKLLEGKDLIFYSLKCVRRCSKPLDGWWVGGWMDGHFYEMLFDLVWDYKSGMCHLYEKDSSVPLSQKSSYPSKGTISGSWPSDPTQAGGNENSGHTTRIHCDTFHPSNTCLSFMVYQVHEVGQCIRRAGEPALRGACASL